MKATLKPGVPSAARTTIKRALRAGKRMSATVAVTATDAAGNTRTLTRQIKLRP